MEPTTEFTPEQLYDQALAHYRAARWPEAMAIIGELLARGHSSTEIDMLVEDIKFKQRLDTTQAPEGAPMPQPRRSYQALALTLGGVLAIVALLGVSLTMALGGSASPAALGPLVGSLPTPAPTTLVIDPDLGPGVGSLGVGLADGATLALGVENVYIILDASGSMLAKVGDRRKIDIAQEALVGLVEQLPTGANVALRTYGRQRPDDCSDVELVNPLAPLDPAGMIAQIEAIEPVNLSRTPIGSSLSAVPVDLGEAGGETLVILVSDGEENCDADPAAIAAQLRAERPNLRISVVGFDIAPELRDRLALIADSGGGTYYGADDVTQLAAALEDVVTPRFTVIDTAGTEVGAGQLGERLELPAGAYTVTIGSSPVLLQQSVEVKDGLATLVAIYEDASGLIAEVRQDWRP